MFIQPGKPSTKSLPWKIYIKLIIFIALIILLNVHFKLILNLKLKIIEFSGKRVLITLRVLRSLLKKRFWSRALKCKCIPSVSQKDWQETWRSFVGSAGLNAAQVNPWWHRRRTETKTRLRAPAIQRDPEQSRNLEERSLEPETRSNLFYNRRCCRI